jgi:Predicted protease
MLLPLLVKKITLIFIHNNNLKIMEMKSFIKIGNSNIVKSKDTFQALASNSYTPVTLLPFYELTNIKEPEGFHSTILIIGAYKNNTVYDDLNKFSLDYNLPLLNAPTNFPAPNTNGLGNFYLWYQQGSQIFFSPNHTLPDNFPEPTPNIPTSLNTDLESALDTQWAHAFSPYSNIILLLSESTSTTNIYSILFTFLLYLGEYVNVVSMSFGTSEGPSQLGIDEYFAEYPNIIFVASSGDVGGSINYPAASPHVLSVGGTTITCSDPNSRCEKVWVDAGGGKSAYETVTPFYQNIVFPNYVDPTSQQYPPAKFIQTYGFGRIIPDVSLIADPDPGAVILFRGETLSNIGGTSLSAPCWAGIIAYVIQLRKKSINQNDLFSKIYNTLLLNGTKIYTNNNFKNIPSGPNGTHVSLYGYDTRAGIGTPKCSVLIQTLLTIP